MNCPAPSCLENGRRPASGPIERTGWNRDARLGRQSRRQTVSIPHPLSRRRIDAAAQGSAELDVAPAALKSGNEPQEAQANLLCFLCSSLVPFVYRSRFATAELFFQLCFRRFNKLRRRFSMFIFPFLHYLRRPDANR